MAGTAIDLGQPVNWNCPLVSGLTSWRLHGAGRDSPNQGGSDRPWRDLLGRTILQTANDPVLLTDTRATGKTGLPGASLMSTINNYTSANNSLSELFFPVATQATVLLVYRHRDTTARNSAAFGVDTGGGSFGRRVDAILPFTDGNIYFDYGGVVEGASRLSVAITKDTLWHWWAFTVGGGFGMRIYRDGVLLASNSGTPSRTLDGGARWQVGGNEFTNADDVDVAEVLTFRRAVPPDHVYAWMDQSRRGHPDTISRYTRRVYSFKAVGGGGGGGGARRRRVLITASGR